MDEWLALPWWQRRLYLEGIAAEFTPRDESSGGGDLADVLMNGSMDDVAAATGA